MSNGSVVTCPYRGGIINELVPKGPAHVCNHPDVRKPCVLLRIAPVGIRSCLSCKYWLDEAPTVQLKLASLPPLEPCTFELAPPEPVRKPGSDVCLHLGQATGEVTPCSSCKGTKLKVFECAVYGSATLAKRGEGVKGCCKGCPSYKKQIVINCNIHGFGDAILAAWIAKGQPESVQLYATGKKRELLEMLGIPVATALPANYFKIDTGPVDKSVSALSHHVGATQVFKRPTVTPLPNGTKWAKEKLGKDGKKLIVIATRSANSVTREWPFSHWMELVEKLYSDGFQLALSGDAWRDRRVIDIPYGWEFSAAAMKKADLVICGDSGPMHLAGTVGKPTVALLGPTTERIASHMDTVRCLFTEQRVMPCTGCWWKAPLYTKERCGNGCESIALIQPETVYAHAMNLLKETLVPLTPLTLPDTSQWLPVDELSKLVSRCRGPSDHHSLQEPTHDRRRTFTRLFEEAKKRFNNPHIVETGCIRQDNDWEGAGFSTYLLGVFCQSVGGWVDSIDTDPVHVAFARSRTKELGTVKVHQARGDAWLKEERRLKELLKVTTSWIGVLYCDSCDTTLPEHAQVCLDEVKAALPLLHKDALILIDDTPYSTETGKLEGKGVLAVPYLLNLGWEILLAEYQVLLSRRKP